MITLHVNGAPVEVDVPPETPLLWALREQLGLTGTKFGCGAALCGACTVHVAGAPVRSCVTPVSGAVGHAVTTIEGVRRTDATTEGTPAIAEAVQAAWVARSVAQCGYCQPGMVMTAVALLAANARPSDADIDAAFSGHLCRCGSYQRLRAAVHDAARALPER
jgi:isoquinoline 1-oxidoreductase alpha subunit